MQNDPRSRILLLLQLLLKQTDEYHYATGADILRFWEAHGTQANRKNVYSDIQLLMDFGLDIICIKSTQNRYFIGSRLLELPELKLPHISVDGGEAPYGIGGSGSLPSFSIQWYKNGGILNGATIFGAAGGSLLGGGEAGAEAVLPLSELWKRMTEIVKGIVSGENEENGETVLQTGANITSALTSKAASVRREKESKTTTKETYTSERWGRDGGTTIHQISFTVDISKIKDLPLLYKLIDELKDAQNRTDSPTPVTA